MEKFYVQYKIKGSRGSEIKRAAEIDAEDSEDAKSTFLKYTGSRYELIGVCTKEELEKEKIEHQHETRGTLYRNFLVLVASNKGKGVLFNWSNVADGFKGVFARSPIEAVAKVKEEHPEYAEGYNFLAYDIKDLKKVNKKIKTALLMQSVIEKYR